MLVELTRDDIELLERLLTDHLEELSNRRDNILHERSIRDVRTLDSLARCQLEQTRARNAWKAIHNDTYREVIIPADMK